MKPKSISATGKPVLAFTILLGVSEVGPIGAGAAFSTSTQIFAVSGKTFFVGGDSTNVYAGSEAFLKTSNSLFLVPAPPG